MKKLVLLTLALLLILCLAACGGNENFTSNSTSTKTNAETFESEENTDIIQTDSKETINDSAKWKEFLTDYETWVDDYIAVVKKQKENPTDMTILSDYTKMVTDLTEWTEKADDIAESIEDVDDALEYSKEILRIAEKMTEINE